MSFVQFDGMESDNSSSYMPYKNDIGILQEEKDKRGRKLVDTP